MSWEDELPGPDREEWDRFVAYQREYVVKAMDEAAYVVSLVPDKVDIKFAVETGLAIMLGKPIILVVHPGAEIPGKLRLVADQVIEADLDTEDGQRRVADAIADLP